MHDKGACIFFIIFFVSFRFGSSLSFFLMTYDKALNNMFKSFFVLFCSYIFYFSPCFHNIFRRCNLFRPHKLYMTKYCFCFHSCHKTSLVCLLVLLVFFFREMKSHFIGKFVDPIFTLLKCNFAIWFGCHWFRNGVAINQLPPALNQVTSAQPDWINPYGKHLKFVKFKRAYNKLKQKTTKKFYV